MKKLYTIILTALAAALLATYGVITVKANTTTTTDPTIQKVEQDAFYTNTANTASSKDTLNVLRFSGNQMVIADLFVGNGHADATNTTSYTVKGHTLIANSLPSGVSAYTVTIADQGRKVTVSETKNGVTRTRVGYSNDTVQKQLTQND